MQPTLLYSSHKRPLQLSLDPVRTLCNSTMINPKNFTSVTFSNNWSNGETLFQQLLIVSQEIQAIEIFLAIALAITIRALILKRYHGVPVWPVVGMLPSMLLGLRGNGYEWLTEILLRQNGTFRLKGPWHSSIDCILTSDPRNLEHLLRTKFPMYPKGPVFYDRMKDLLGDGILGVDDEMWQRQRRTASIQMHSSEFREMIAETVVELVHSRLLLVLQEAVNDSITVDLQHILLRLAFDNASIIAFGVDPGCLRPGLPEVPFAKAFEDATEIVSLRFVSPTCIWKAMRFLNLGMERKLKDSIKEVNEFSDNVIRTRKKDLAMLPCDGDKNRRLDLLSVFMGLKDENEQPFSDQLLRDICVNFVIAGKDTSSIGLTWFFWVLDQNPAVEEKIVQEICRIVASREEAKKGVIESSSIIFRPEEIKRMDYLQAAITETLRIYPSVPVDFKEVAEDDILPDGTVLKKGTKVIYAMYAMGRMESIWGEDCKQFKPERWLSPQGRFVSESAYKFSAFNGGPRLCLGKDFAYYQMKFVAASVIFRYHVEVVPHHPVTPKITFTLYMKQGLKVKLYRRDPAELQKYFED